ETGGTEGSAFANAVLDLGLLNERELTAFLAQKTHYPVASKNLAHMVEDNAFRSIDINLLAYLEVVPVSKKGDQLVVAMLDPLDQMTIKQLEFLTPYRIKPMIATRSEIRAVLGARGPKVEKPKTQLQVFLQNHVESA